MNKIILVLVFIALGSLSFQKNMKSGFDIEIIQDGEYMDAVDGIVTLQKAPFTMRVKMYGIEGVQLNSSYTSKMFDLGQTGDIPDFRFIATKTMADEPFNASKELMISEDYYSYLYHDEGSKVHRFDSVQIEAGHVVGYKTIENLNDKDKSKSIKVEKVKNDLYLFFVATTPYEKGVDPVELMRSRMIIKWE